MPRRPLSLSLSFTPCVWSAVECSQRSAVCILLSKQPHNTTNSSIIDATAPHMAWEYANARTRTHKHTHARTHVFPISIINTTRNYISQNKHKLTCHLCARFDCTQPYPGNPDRIMMCHRCGNNRAQAVMCVCVLISEHVCNVYNPNSL